MVLYPEGIWNGNSAAFDALPWGPLSILAPVDRIFVAKCLAEQSKEELGEKLMLLLRGRHCARSELYELPLGIIAGVRRYLQKSYLRQVDFVDRSRFLCFRADMLPSTREHIAKLLRIDFGDSEEIALYLKALKY